MVADKQTISCTKMALLVIALSYSP